MKTNTKSYANPQKAVSDAWKELYFQLKEENSRLAAENEQLKKERDDANRTVERLSAMQWLTPVGF